MWYPAAKLDRVVVLATLVACAYLAAAATTSALAAALTGSAVATSGPLTGGLPGRGSLALGLAAPSGPGPRASAAGAATLPAGRTAYEAIAARNLLAAARDGAPDGAAAAGLAEAGGASPGAAAVELAPCDLPGQLLAIVAAPNPRWSIVVYQARGAADRSPTGQGGPGVYSTLPHASGLEPDAQLVEIRPQAIVVRRGERLQLCPLDGGADRLGRAGRPDRSDRADHHAAAIARRQR